MTKRVSLVLGLVMTSALLSAQTPDVSAIGPKIGAVAAPFTGIDQSGETHTLQSLLDRNGLMLVFFRSADW